MGAQRPFPGLLAELGIRQDLAFVDSFHCHSGEHVHLSRSRATTVALSRIGKEFLCKSYTPSVVPPNNTSRVEEVSTPDRYRPDHRPQCPARQPLIAHGFHSRTLVEAGFDGSIGVRRYLCRCCRRTVSLLPQFALP